MRRDNEPYELCRIFKILFETEHGAAAGKYFITGRDLRAAKELHQLNADLQRSDLVEPIKSYFKDAYWAARNFPAYGLFEHFSHFAGKSITDKQIVRSRDDNRQLLISCTDCGTNHVATELCPRCTPSLSGDRQSALDEMRKLFGHFGKSTRGRHAGKQ